MNVIRSFHLAFKHNAKCRKSDNLYNGQEVQRAARGSITLIGLQKMERALLEREKGAGTREERGLGRTFRGSLTLSRPNIVQLISAHFLKDTASCFPSEYWRGEVKQERIEATLLENPNRERDICARSCARVSLALFNTLT